MKWITALVCTVVFICVGCSATPAGPTVAPEILIDEGKAAIDNKQYEEAITKLEQAIANGAKEAQPHFLLGNAYAQQERFEQAEAAYLKALDVEPSFTDARSNLGVVYYRQFKLPEARAAFEQAAIEIPQDAEICYNLGGVLAAMDDMDGAVEQFLRANTLDPSLAEPYLGLGSVYFRQGKTAQAKEALLKFLSLSDDPTWRSQAEQMLTQIGQ